MSKSNTKPPSLAAFDDTSSLQKIQSILKDINSTSDLVDTLNHSGQADKAIYQRLFQEYTFFFSKKALSKLEEADIIEYSRLAKANIDPDAKEADLLHGYFETWRTKLDSPGESDHKLGLGTKHVLRALNPLLFCWNVEVLFDVAAILLERLPNDTKEFTERTYIPRRDMLISVCQALNIMKQVNNNKWEPEGTEALIKRFRAKLKVIADSGFFPFKFQMVLLSQSLNMLSARKVKSPQMKNPIHPASKIISKLQEDSVIFEVEEGICDVIWALEGLFQGNQEIKDKLEFLGEPDKCDNARWHDWLLCMAYAAAYSLDDKEGEFYFSRYFEQGLHKLPGLEGGDSFEEVLSLRYGVIQQLTAIAICGKTVKLQVRCIDWICNLLGIERSMQEDAGWKYEKHLVEALLNSLAAIAIDGKKEVSQIAYLTLDECMGSGDSKGRRKRGRKGGNGFFGICLCEARGDLPSTIVSDWVGSDTLRTKLDRIKTLRNVFKRKPGKSKLYSKVTKEVEAKNQMEREAKKRRLNDAKTAQILSKKLSHHYTTACEYMPSVSGRKRTYTDGYVKPQFKREIVESYKNKTEELVLQVLKSPRSEVANRGQESVALLGVYDGIEKSQTSVKLEDIFKVRNLPSGDEGIPKDILVEGADGSGKTTLCLYLAYSWGIGECEINKFDSVFVIEARKLDPNWKSLSEAIVNGAFSHLEDQEKKQMEQAIRDQIENRLFKVLLILDNMEDCRPGTIHLLKEAVRASSNVHRLWTSTPYHEDYKLVEHFDLKLKLEGLSSNRICEFVQKYFKGSSLENSSQMKSVFDFLDQNSHYQKMASLPFLLEIICANCESLNESSNQLKCMGSRSTILGIFTEHKWEQLIARKDLFKKEQPKLSTDRLHFENALGYIALSDMANFSAIKNLPVFEQNFSEVTVLLENCVFLKQRALVNVNSENKKQEAITMRFEMRHSFFKYFFAARFLAHLLTAEGTKKKALSFITVHKYNLYSSQLLQFLAGEIFRSHNGTDSSKFRAMLGFLEAPPIEVVGLQHLILKLRCVYECVGSGGNFNEYEHKSSDLKMLQSWAEAGLRAVSRGQLLPEIDFTIHRNVVGAVSSLPWLMNLEHFAPIWMQACLKGASINVRLATADALGHLVCAYPNVAPKVIPALVTALDSEHMDVRSAAVLAMRNVAVASHAQALTCLKNLAVSCADSEEQVWTTAVHAIEDIIDTHDSLAATILPLLLEYYKDKDWKKRRGAIAALPYVIKAPNVDYKSAFQVLVAACDDLDKEVKTTAMASIGEIVKFYPLLVASALQPLIAACKDFMFRRIAVTTITKVVKSNPTQAKIALQPLLAACNDPHEDVRWSAVVALGGVLSADKSHAQAALKPLLAACRDKDWRVRRGAIPSLPEVMDVSSTDHSALKCLIAAGMDEDWHVRKLAVQAFGDAVKRYPSLAMPMRRALVLACKDEDWRVRRGAVPALADVVEVDPIQATAALRPIIQACQDEDTEVRVLAVDSLSRIVKVDSSQASDVLRPLLTACRDEELEVRTLAMTSAAEVVSVEPAKAPIVLRTLLNGCMQEEEKSSWIAAVHAFGMTIRADPSHAGDMLQRLKQASNDERWKVRRGAVFAMSEVVKADPLKAPETIETLTRACRDEDHDVRKVAAAAFGEIIRTSPSVAEAALGPITKACNDEDGQVRESAELALAEIIKADPNKSLAALQQIGFTNDEEYNKERPFRVRHSALEALHQMQVQWLMNLGVSVTKESSRNLPSLIVMHRLVSTPLTIEQMSPHSSRFKLTLHEATEKKWAMSERNTKSIQATINSFKELCHS